MVKKEGEEEMEEEEGAPGFGLADWRQWRRAGRGGAGPRRGGGGRSSGEIGRAHV